MVYIDYSLTPEQRKQNLLSLETEKDIENYYLDSEGQRLSFNGDRGLRPAHRKLKLTQRHIEEITKCALSLEYFVFNYCQVKTKTGYNFPELREYQLRTLKTYQDNQNVVALMGRQSGKCCSQQTKITIKNKKTEEIQEIEIGKFHEMIKKREFNILPFPILDEVKNKKFTEEFNVSDWEVLSNDGFHPILSSNKTIEYQVYEVILENGKSIKCADTHILIDKDRNEVFAQDSLGIELITSDGISKAVEVIIHPEFENMYDLSVDSEEQIYFTNGILSHNTVTSMLYFVWLTIFHQEKTYGIAANLQKMSVEILDKFKETYSRLPFWLMQGIVTWNKTSIKLENGCQVLTSATTENAFRGFSLNGGLFFDEAAWVPNSLWSAFADSVFPALSAFPDSKLIITSTPNGFNHFHKIWNEAEEGKNGFTPLKVEWSEVPGRDQKWLEKQIDQFGELFCQQNYICSFLGSSDTLINSASLEIQPVKSPEMRDNFVQGFNQYFEPEESKKYVIGVDTSKASGDFTGIQVLDVTEFPFKQVATAKLQIDHLLLPEIINNIGLVYNNAFVIIENNEGSGQSTADALWNTYDYENLHFDDKKKYAGFRTTAKTRKRILSLIKTLIENKKLSIYDNDTLEEFFHFVNLNGKYQADDGYHDDLIMSLALCMAPFLDVKKFDDYRKFVSIVFSDQDENESLDSAIVFGNFDDGSSTEVDYSKALGYTYEGFGENLYQRNQFGDYSGF